MIPLGLKRLARRFLDRLVDRPARRAADETTAPLAATVSLLDRRIARAEHDLSACRAEIARLGGTIARLEASLAAERARADRAETRAGEADADRAALRDAIDALGERADRAEAEGRETFLAARAAAFRPPPPGRETAPKPDPVRLLSPAALDAKLAALAPAAHRPWRVALEANRRAYDGTPTDSCSVDGHAVAERFRRFLAPLLRGAVLDIGCGVQERPLYLDGWPDRLVAGIDPLDPPSPHPFTFARATAEFLPWPDASFDLAVAATSLDHVLHPARAFAECARILKPGGRFVVWEWIVPEAAPYDPVNGPIAPVDDFHLFQFDMKSFLAASGDWFEVEEDFAPPAGRSRFLTLRRRDA